MSARDSLTDYHGWTLALTAYSYGGGEPKYFSPWLREIGIALICAAVAYFEMWWTTYLCDDDPNARRPPVPRPRGLTAQCYWREDDA